MSPAAEKRTLSRRAQLAVTVGALLLVAALGWFFLVSPQRSRSSALDEEIAAMEAQITQARRASLAAPAPKIETADIFRLAKAMPDQVDMPGILLELSRLAAEVGIEFRTIAPGVPAAAGGYRAVPITLSFEGNFYSLSDFLFRLRSMVRVAKGTLSATGRLFTVSTLSFSPTDAGFPEISAQLTVDAYIYGAALPEEAAAAAPAAAPPPAEPAEGEPEDPAASTEPPPADAAPAGGGS